MTISLTNPAAVKERLAAGESIVLLDVREQSEVEEWSYPVAIHIPLGELEARVGEVPKGVQIICACHAGGRSMKAAAFLDSLGYEVVNLEGGRLAWAEGDA
jgi:rhodanese-related sulfurtransferase